MKYVTSREACKALGVHSNTLRRWASEGKIQYYKSDTGQRRYNIKSFIGLEKEKENYCYCRVSSTKQRDDLQRQVQYMQQQYPGYKIIKDIGSGVNFKRKGLIALLEQAIQGGVGQIVVGHKDRLARFGFELIEWLVTSNGGKLLVLNGTKESPEQELTNDLLTILEVFSFRLHGLRKYRDQIKEDPFLSKRGAKADS